MRSRLGFEIPVKLVQRGVGLHLQRLQNEKTSF
jgi:hypothetical protein